VTTVSVGGTNGTGTADAACKGVNDILLNGGCSVQNYGVELSVPTNNPAGTASYWTCTVNPGISPVPSVTAMATCITVP
jgi:hypothetical protein